MRSLLSLGRSLVIALVALAGAGLPSPLAAGQAPPGVCQPTPAVAAVLERVRNLWLDCGASPDCNDRVLGVLDAGLEEHPGDFHLERARQRIWRFYDLPEEKAERRQEVLDAYGARAEARPDDPVAAYLAARAETDPEVARELFLEAIEADPSFPWSHLGLITADRIARRPPDAAAERRHLVAFLDRCPAEVAEVATVVRAIEMEPVWRERLAAGHERMARMASGDLAKRYEDLGTIWDALYASTPLEEHASLTPVVRADLERIAALELVDEDAWWRVRETGHELIGDTEGKRRMTDERIARFPCLQAVARLRYAAWREANDPGEEASEAETERYATAMWNQGKRWREECPETVEYRLTPLDAARAGADLSDAEYARLEEEMIALQEEGLRLSHAAETILAQLFVDEGVRLHRVDALVDRGEAIELERNREARENPAYPAARRERLAKQVAHIRWHAAEIRTGGAIAREDGDGARERLAEQAALLDELNPGDDAAEDERQRFRFRESRFLALSAELAEREGRHADAAALYARASEHHRTPEEPRAKGREAWSRAGGGAEGWQALTEAALGAAGGEGADRAIVGWNEKELALPAEIELADLSGETWTRADLEGKTLFVNLWATWCGPCREELPKVETLYETTKGRDDVRVVTFNLDANPGAALRYAEEAGFTFPVLLAGDLIEEMGETGALPRSWIVDPALVVRREQVGYDDSDGWAGRILELLERYGEESGPDPGPDLDPAAPAEGGGGAGP